MCLSRQSVSLFVHLSVAIWDAISCLFFFRKEAHFTEERIEELKALSKMPDIYERLARALGQLNNTKHAEIVLTTATSLCIKSATLFCIVGLV